MRHIRSPFPYFGGKKTIANIIWQAFDSNVTNYVEPFFGSGAVFLARSGSFTTRLIETINEKNPFIANFWLSISQDPEAVAFYASDPVMEVVQHSRHLWLVNNSNLKARMLEDPMFYDPKAAGWWVWGHCAWIGSGWCSDREIELGGDGDKDEEEDKDEEGVSKIITPRQPSQQLPHLSGGRGVNRSLSQKLPHLSSSQGVNSSHTVSKKLPHLGDAGRGVNRTPSQQLPYLGGGMGVTSQTTRQQGLVEYFEELRARLQWVRVTCGDWTRVMGECVTTGNGMTGVFLDPPYLTGSDLYNGQTTSVALDVLEWCKANWSNPKLRIAFCGYEGEFEVPDDWLYHKWVARPGYQAKGGNGERERIWLSPACLPVDKPPTQATLF